jgi:hypothetical protein
MKQTFVIILIFISNLIYGQIPNELTNAEKIYGLSKFWQEVNYNFVYLNKVDKTEWNNQYKKLITEVQNTANDYEYYRLLQKFCATLNDGHTNVWFPKEIQDKILNNDFGEYKIILSNIDGKAIITKVNKSKLSELPIGTEIIKVNGIPTKEYVNQNVKPYISSSTQHILNDLSITYMLEGFIGSKFKLELRLPNGNIKTINLTHKESTEQELYPEEKNELFEFKWINDETAYIAL